MSDIQKLIQVQSWLLDSMLNITEDIKRETAKGFSIEQQSKDLLRLAIVFDTLKSVYIERND